VFGFDLKQMKTILTISLFILSELVYSQMVIKGRVMDFFDNTPLVNVEIRISPKDAVISDLNGYFLLEIGTNSRLSFSFPGLMDLVFMPQAISVDTLECDFYMIPIEPYKPCIADGYIKRTFRPDEPICSNYQRKMDKKWMKTRRLDNYTPLNWRLGPINENVFSEKAQKDLIFEYQISFSSCLKDYRDYDKMTEKDYIYCELKK
jgi:hypothetical protein